MRNLAGLLLLHIAVRKNQSIPTLKVLLRYYPNAIVAETSEGKTPSDIAEDVSLARQDGHDQLAFFSISNQQETILDDEFPVFEDSQISSIEADEDEIDFMKPSFRAISLVYYGISSKTEHPNNSNVSSLISPCNNNADTNTPRNKNVTSDTFFYQKVRS
jgi:hypothetical protein